MKLEISDFGSLVQVPATFEVARTSDEAIEKIVTAWPFMADPQHNMLVVCGSGGFSRAMADDYIDRLKLNDTVALRVEPIAVGSLAEARRIDALCAELNIDLLVGVGGGRVIDVVKLVAFHRKVALLCIPSVLASDGITSPISVLMDDEGRRRSLPSGIPSCVVVDLSLTVQAPLRLTKAGVGDLLSNTSAMLDLEDHELAGFGAASGFGKLLSTSACQLVLGLTEEQIASAEGQEIVAKALIMSGLSMAFAGNSLPCSGAEHLISHAIDQLELIDAPHGLQVAVATLFCLRLREVLGGRTSPVDLRAEMQRMNLPLSPGDLGLTRAQFLEAVELAPTTRDRKYTILHHDRAPAHREKAYDLAFA